MLTPTLIPCVDANLRMPIDRGRGYKNLPYLLLKAGRVAVAKSSFLRAVVISPSGDGMEKRDNGGDMRLRPEGRDPVSSRAGALRLANTILMTCQEIASRQGCASYCYLSTSAPSGLAFRFCFPQRLGVSGVNISCGNAPQAGASKPAFRNSLPPHVQHIGNLRLAFHPAVQSFVQRDVVLLQRLPQRLIERSARVRISRAGIYFRDLRVHQ